MLQFIKVINPTEVIKTEKKKAAKRVALPPFVKFFNNQNAK